MKIKPTEQAILNYLEAHGGQSAVGQIGSTRPSTIRYLENLESLGLIVCVERPVINRGKQVAPEEAVLKMPRLCGVWKLAEKSKEKAGAANTSL